MLYVLDKNDSIDNNFLSELRDSKNQMDRRIFRSNLEQIGRLLAFELSKSLNYKKQLITTPNGEKTTTLLDDRIVLISILRAAIPFYQGFVSIFQDAESGFIGSARANEPKEQKDLKIDLGYISSPNLNNKEVLLIDPMLATGKSFLRAMDELKKFGVPNKIHICSLISAPEGIENIQKASADINIWTCSVDDQLDDNLFIVPGLGDAGDLAFGPKI